MTHDAPSRFAIALTLVVAAGCSTNPSGFGPDAADIARTNDTAVNDAPTDTASDAVLDAVDPHAGDIVSLTIDPANPTIVSINGATTAEMFVAHGVRRDGTTMDVHPQWSLASNGLGTIDANGMFVADGVHAGTTQVIAAYNGGSLRAMTNLTVNLRHDVVVSGAPSDAASHFSGTPVADAARSAAIVYPLDGAVMPQNVAPADVQWTAGNPGDLFRVHLHTAHVDVNGYVLHTGTTFGFDWLVGTAEWRTVAQNDVAQPVTITVDRFDAARGDVVAGTPITMRFANGSTQGSVYYWSIGAHAPNGGGILRIDDGTNTPVNFLPHPTPIDPGSACGSSTACIGCHSISRDGHYLAVRTGGCASNVGAVYDLTRDLTGNPAMPTYTIAGGANWRFSAWNADNTRLVVENGSLTMLNPTTGAVIPWASGSIDTTCLLAPALSPDGHSIAYVSSANAGPFGACYSVNFTHGDLSVSPLTGDRIGAGTVVHQGGSLSSASEGGSTDSWPSWSPDSQWLAFAHGQDNRSDHIPGFPEESIGSNGLYVVSAHGGGAVRLDRASGGTMETRNGAPAFSPFDAGGYFWLSFDSRRPYGNAHVGSAGMTDRSQIWIAAVHHNPDGTTDPSEVGYWLPGQTTTEDNITAVWAPRPCRTDGTDCGVSSECCSGVCNPSGSGGNTCQPPPPAMCHAQGDLCSTSGDCCAPLACQGHLCVPPG